IHVPHPELTRGPGWGILSTEPPFSTQTAADGSYSLTGLNPGTYRISTSNVFFPTRVSVGGTLAPGGNEEANLTLVSTLAGKIQGNVVRPDGTTSVGPGIRVTLSGGSLAEATVLTDENGHYEFGEVFSAGSYNLTATDPASGQTNRISVSVERNKDAVFNLRLLGFGTLRVQVLDGAGQPATGGSVTIDGTDYPNVHRFANVPVGSNGQVTFENLPEGSYAVSATRFGLGGRVSARVTINATVDVSVQLQATGNVEGYVYLPDGTTAISLADVQLRVGGRSIGYTVTSEGPDVGKFTFVNVPTGDFTLDAFDNHTGRVGRAAGTVTTQGETVVVNVLLLPIGAVRGQVTANGVGVDHALVRITADGSGVRGANLFATTDPNGNYRFTGIPAGRFVITVADAPGGQTGSASGTISGTVEPLPDTIVNIALEPSQTVRGTVYLNGGTQPVPGAQVTITVAGRVFQTATNDQGVYALAFVPLGTVNVRAEAPVGYDRGEAAPVTGTQPGGTVTANVTMNGVGIVSGTALDSNGSPLTSGTVTFTNSIWSPAVVINASVQPNGTFEITGVPAGNFSLRLTVPGRVAVGSASGTALAGQTTNVTLQLEDAGTVTGRVHAADGSTPVQGASVSVTLNRPSGQVSFFTHTGAQGIWTLNNVPLGTLDIKVTDEVSGGVARARNVVLATNGQVVDVGTMLLDSTPISVLSVEPANGAVSVPTNGTVVTITFSEPAEASSVTSGTVQLQLNNSNVSVTRSLSSDGRVVTLTPNNRLTESAVYKVFVNQVEDRAGLRIASAFTSTFTTADETAPSVTAISPANGATEVAPGVNVVVTFSEPIDSTDNLANIIKVSVSQATDTLAGNYVLSADGRVATFTPAVALSDSTAYTVNINGQRDAAGNTQTQAVVTNFVTQDR
ncbi:MAG TPA: carboxypeptidase regulatory-like domain-containing protein, partial [Pyrinomonadaceae bacterium]